MKYRALGKSGIDVSLLSLGTGGASQFGQKTGVDDAGRKKLVHAAIDLGVNLFDTSERYGRSEELLGKALEGIPRDSYLLATKWHTRPDDEFLPPEALVASVDESLRLLKTDVIDVMQFHGILPGHYEYVAENYLPLLQSLKEQGKVRLIGFTEMMVQDSKHTVPLQGLREHADVWDMVMLKYGILNQWAAKESLPLA
jgi:aryl-alcohol dehydrogenase-like predicted oxidoreductase